jgi:2'-5' RNA ligase
VIRTFVAVKLESPVLERISALTSALKPRIPGIRWVPTENLHLTLKFLGRVDEKKIEAIINGLDEVFRPFPRFAIHAKGLGVFPDLKRARVLWVGLRGDNLNELAFRTDTALELFGFAREKRAFAPHLTIGRWRQYDGSPTELGKELERWKEHELGSSTVKEVCLFESVLHRQGATYRPLKIFPLTHDPAA